MEYFWLIVAMLILFALVRKPFKENVLGALDARAEQIRKELDEAQRLHEEARTMLANYQRQLQEGEGLAKDILERAASERQRLEAKLKEDYTALSERRTQQALDRISQEEARAVQEVRSRAAALAVRATREILNEKLQGSEVERVMRSSIEDVTRRLA